MSKLSNELISKGFTKKLLFVKDSTVKIFVVSNLSANNVRTSVIGDLNQPLIELTHQNPTIKDIQDGVRFHLSKAV